MLHWNRGGSRCWTFTKHLKEPSLLHLKAQENPSSSLLLEALKTRLWLCELPFSAAASGYGSNELLKACLWFMDSFLNTVSNNQIFLCFNCGARHPRHYKPAQNKPAEFGLCARWTSHLLGLFTLFYLSSCPCYLLSSHMLKLNLKIIKPK